MKNQIISIGKKSRKAFSVHLNSKKKDKVLMDYCKLLVKSKDEILNENKKDIKNAIKKKFKDNLIQRLILNEEKIINMSNSIREITKLKDPTNVILEN